MGDSGWLAALRESWAAAPWRGGAGAGGENEPVVECSSPGSGQAGLGCFVEMALAVVGSVSEDMAIVLLEGEVAGLWRGSFYC